ncbi:MAG: ATP-binding protein, partial [Kineosporiaceae bacterium]
GAEPSEISWRSEDFTRIAAYQLADEDAAVARAARDGARLVVCDTDALATAIWHERYLGEPSPAVRRVAAARRYDLYLLTGDEIPFVQDGLRDGEHVRGWMTARFRTELAARPEPWVEVTGTRQQRLATAVAAVTPLLAGGPRRP